MRAKPVPPLLDRLRGSAPGGRPRRALLRLARPWLAELASATGETVSLAVPRGGELVYVDQLQGPHVMAADSLGRAVPLRATSTGKAFLARLLAAELDALLAAALERYTARAITDPARLRAELAEVRRRSGAGQCRGELEPALWGVSAAVVDGRGVLAVASVWGAEGRLGEQA